MQSRISDAELVKLMKQGLSRRKIEQRMKLCISSSRYRRLREENEIADLRIPRQDGTTEMLIELLKKGLGSKKIAAAMGREIDSGRLTRLRAQLGIVRPRKKSITTSELTALVLQGMSNREVKAATGVSACERKLRRLRDDHGVETRSRRRCVEGADVRLYKRIRKSLAHVGDAMLRDDAISEMYLAVIDGHLAQGQVEKEARRYGNAQFAQWSSKFGPQSLDEIQGENDWSLLDSLEDRSALEAFDRIFDDIDDDDEV